MSRQGRCCSVGYSRTARGLETGKSRTMKRNEIIAGEYYWTMVSGRLCPVRVVSWVRKGKFACINVETGRVIARAPYQIIAPLTEDEVARIERKRRESVAAETEVARGLGGAFCEACGEWMPVAHPVECENGRNAYLCHECSGEKRQLMLRRPQAVDKATAHDIAYHGEDYEG